MPRSSRLRGPFVTLWCLMSLGGRYNKGCGFLKMVRDYGEYARVVFKSNSNATVLSRTPAPGMVKINVDASVMEGGMIVLGAIIRDDTGLLLAVGVHGINAHWKANLAEVMAARFGLLVA